MKTYLKLVFNFLVLFSLISIGGCNKQEKKVNEKSDESQFVNIDLASIKERGKLIAITGYSSTSYFIYRGQPMGYEYELLQKFCKHLGVELEILIAPEIDDMFNMLQRGEGDMIAYSLTVTKTRSQRVAFADYHNEVRQVLVQRKPEGWQNMPIHKVEKKLIRNPLKLEGKTIYVRRNSAYVSRLKNLSDEIGGNINILEAPENMSTEELIRKVSYGDIDYTVADENMAMVNATFYTNLDVKTALSFPQKIAWAVRKQSPDLLNAINNWIDKMRNTADYYVIYNKYYKNRKAYRERVGSDYLLVNAESGKISKYDDLLKKEGKKINWDWRLLAAQIYQESKFDPHAESWAGAVGLMQLIPATAQRFGANNLYDPKQSLEAGTSFLQWLDNYWSKEIPDSTERIKFVLASYNVGPGHVEDARRLAKKYGDDPNVWDNSVAEYLRYKSRRKYYNDEVVKFGYCRGDEPYFYVKEIMDRYHQYVKVLDHGQPSGTSQTG